MSTVDNIRVVTKNGQISLGKKFAGKTIQIIENDNHTLTIIPVIVIPENEKWLYMNNNMEKIDKSIEWAESNDRVDNCIEIIQKIENDKS